MWSKEHGDNSHNWEIVDSENSDESFSDEENLEVESTTCLFCDTIFESMEVAINHLDIVHGINLHELKNKFHMDQYSYIKMVNYIRIENPLPEIFPTATKPFWEDDKYLKPVEYEPWLTYDFENLQIEQNNDDLQNVQSDGVVDEKARLENIIHDLTKQVREKNAILEQAHNDISKMRAGFHALLDKDLDTEVPRNCIGSVPLRFDEGYFNSYAHFGIHHEMLSDSVRTLSYRDALFNNASVIKGKTVLDVGCGTSILSMFSSHAGADKVIAIDNSDVIYNAMEIVKTNNFENISVIKGRLEDTQLPIDKFDVIVSEWMGYFLIFEGMLDTIIYARNRHLKEGGLLIPNRCNISIVGYGDEEKHKAHISFWDSVYGFNMSSMKRQVLIEPLIDICKPECVLTEPNVIVEYDLYSVDFNYSNFSFDFNLKVIETGMLTSVVGYFDTFFDLPNKVSFSTSPTSEKTHWRQVIFFLNKPVEVKEGSEITGKINCRRSKRKMRSLIIKITIFGREHFYHFD